MASASMGVVRLAIGSVELVRILWACDARRTPTTRALVRTPGRVASRSVGLCVAVTGPPIGIAASRPAAVRSRQVVLTGVSSHLRDQLVSLSRRRSILRESPDRGVEERQIQGRLSGAVTAEIVRLYLAGTHD